MERRAFLAKSVVGTVTAIPAIGRIRWPETRANLCFGGVKRSRLFVTASQSLYVLYVNTQGAQMP